MFRRGYLNTEKLLCCLNIPVGVIDLVWSRGLDIGVFVDRDQGRSIKKQKRTWPISSHLDRTSLIDKGFIIMWLSGKCFLHGREGSPSRRDSTISPAWLANYSPGFGSSCLLMELAI